MISRGWLRGGVLAGALSLVTALAVSSIAPRSSSAQTPETATSGPFKSGLDKYDAKDFVGAARDWEQYLAEDETRWRTLYNLGLAYEAASDAPNAVERYESFVKRVGEEPGTLPAELEERRQDAVERAAKLRAGLGRVSFVGASGSERVTFRIDGGALLVAPAQKYLTPGRHVIVAGEGTRARGIEIEVVAGRMDQVAVAPLPLPPPSSVIPPSSKRRVTTESFPTAVVIGGASLTAVSFTLPLGLGLHASGLRSDAIVLGRGNSKYAVAKGDYESARTGYYVSYVVPAVLGAVTIGVAIYGAVRAGRHEVDVAITSRAGGGDLSVMGSF